MNLFHLRVLAVLALLGVAVFPMWWMFVTSLTPSAALFSKAPSMLPDLGQFPNYGAALRDTSLLTWLGNSLIIAFGTMALSLVLAVLPAYALSRMRFRGMLVLALGLFITQMLPEAMLVVPLYDIFARFGLLNSLGGLILANTAFAVPVVTWILKGAIDGIPTEIEEAARIDGAGEFRIFFQVALPLAKPALATLAVLSFLGNWNDFLWPVYVLLSPENMTLQPGLAMLQGAYRTHFGIVMAGAAIASIPVLVLFAFAQRQIVDSVAGAAVKG